jgi:hypothetical protein
MGRSARSGKFLHAISSLHHHSLFPTPGHVIDEGAVDIGASATDGIEKRVRVCDKILFVGQLVRDDLGVTDLAKHHQAT